eukprot:TRINITY_DN16148_c0_g1_i6.p3 TRINITY_DN16148_c0_g1~~TRINITY_DN16148_c0_g1_i6.p3  ORF type:complete len:153 (+),score=27.02 TRINITY_DN16148_c0_g1_i6:680-1138(+)
MLAPGSLIEHLEHQAWDMCARIANPQPGYATSMQSESPSFAFSESPSFALSCTPPDSMRWQVSAPLQQGETEQTGTQTHLVANSTSAPMAIPQRGEEIIDPNEICRVDHLLSESGTIFTPGEHKWICEASPPQNPLLNMMMQGGPPRTSQEC